MQNISQITIFGTILNCSGGMLLPYLAGGGVVEPLLVPCDAWHVGWGELVLRQCDAARVVHVPDMLRHTPWRVRPGEPAHDEKRLVLLSHVPA